MAYYYATILQIDHHVGRLVDLLKEKGIYDNTLIVLTADHGEYLGFRRDCGYSMQCRHSAAHHIKEKP
jgi:arylsulfatase A-like enzyme